MFKSNKNSTGRGYKILVGICSAAITAAIGYLFVWAGNLNPSAGPADTMRTLDDIYCAMSIDCTPGTYSIDSPGSPASTMRTLKEIYDKAVKFPLPDTGQTTPYGTIGYDAYYTSANSFTCDMSFTANINETITDNCTGLMWKRCSEGLSGSTCGTGSATRPTWQDAKAQCENLSFAGYTDWRLPNVKELISIINYQNFQPAVDTTYFPATVSGYYWSSTTYTASTDLVSSVDFMTGDVNGMSKTEGLFPYVRCVRGQ